MWKVVVWFNEEIYPGEGEETVVNEKVFDKYPDMIEYVYSCKRTGIEGMVMRYHPKIDIWSYYMDIR